MKTLTYLMNFVKFACNKHLMIKNKTQCLISMSMSSITYTNFATNMTHVPMHARLSHEGPLLERQGSKRQQAVTRSCRECNLATVLLCTTLTFLMLHLPRSASKQSTKVDSLEDTGVPEPIFQVGLSIIFR